MITTEKAVEAIKNKIETLEKISNIDVTEFDIWQDSTSKVLSHICQKNEPLVKKFKNIQSTEPYGNKGARIGRVFGAKKESKLFLSCIISEIRLLGLLEFQNSGLIEENYQQNNTISIEFLKDELNSSEIADIKEILETEEEAEKKKKMVLDKIKSLENDVTCNILANILINSNLHS